MIHCLVCIPDTANIVGGGGVVAAVDTAIVEVHAPVGVTSFGRTTPVAIGLKRCEAGCL